VFKNLMPVQGVQFQTKMKYYSQSNEAAIVLDYFEGRNGVFLDIGANDGMTFSNTYDLVLNGWSGVCIEPSPVAFERLSVLHAYNPVQLCQLGITRVSCKRTFYESGTHVRNGSDLGLVSTLHSKERQRWAYNNVEYAVINAEFKSFADFMELSAHKQFDFISIDAEGEDWNILRQIDLAAVGCVCICVEWNGDERLEVLYRHHCARYGLREIGRNMENIIYGV
jgi:FkbM family methyltransferase